VSLKSYHDGFKMEKHSLEAINAMQCIGNLAFNVYHI